MGDRQGGAQREELWTTEKSLLRRRQRRIALVLLLHRWLHLALVPLPCSSSRTRARCNHRYSSSTGATSRCRLHCKAKSRGLWPPRTATAMPNQLHSAHGRVR